MASLMPVVLCSDARHVPLADGSVHCVVTSPPYWGLRSYSGDAGMIGLEETFDEHLANLVSVFREVRRVLRDDGTCWLNYGDAYSGGKSAGRNDFGGTTGLGGTIGGGKSVKITKSDPVGLKPKDLMMMPARVAMALQADGEADSKAARVLFAAHFRDRRRIWRGTNAGESNGRHREALG